MDFIVDYFMNHGVIHHHLSCADWEVHVFTADKIMAGTDANVFITLYGKRGVSRRKPLTKSSKKNAFERGEEDTFLIRTDYLGPISRIR